MAIYELVCIFHSEAKVQKSLVKKVETWLKDLKAKVRKKETWGKKELAYPIKKQKEGSFFFWEFEAEPDQIVKIFAKVKMEEKILRHLLIRTKRKGVAKNG